jgi:hypothetical protein
MSEVAAAAAVLLQRQAAERVVGLSEGRHGKVLLTVQGDGVITLSSASEVGVPSRGAAAVAPAATQQTNR